MTRFEYKFRQHFGWTKRGWARRSRRIRTATSYRFVGQCFYCGTWYEHQSFHAQSRSDWLIKPCWECRWPGGVKFI